MPHSPATMRPNTASAPRLMAERLDVYLPGLQSDNARRVFLRKLDANLRTAYGRYLTTGIITTDPSFAIEDEFDFSATIEAIAQRLDALKIAEAA